MWTNSEVSHSLGTRTSCTPSLSGVETDVPGVADEPEQDAPDMGERQESPNPESRSLTTYVRASDLMDLPEASERSEERDEALFPRIEIRPLRASSVQARKVIAVPNARKTPPAPAPIDTQSDALRRAVCVGVGWMSACSRSEASR